MSKTEDQIFNDWNGVKKRLQKTATTPHVTEGEIWWCGLGYNLGVEVHGKGRTFSRPVLVFKKLSRFCFLGIPLSTKRHTGSWYASFTFKNKFQNALLSQVKIISVYRLYNRLGEIDQKDLYRIRQRFCHLFLPKNTPKL